MERQDKNIKNGSRYSQILEGDIYGGWVTALTAPFPLPLE